MQQGFTNLFRGTRSQLQPPVDDIESYWSPAEKAQVTRMLECSFIGAPRTVCEGLDAFIERTGADEVMVAAGIHDHAARLRSYERLSAVRSRAHRGDAGST
jgi:alkanesulfonate monooxygenase SsuD/methylene tetrahydromethanopterin reductase-like flavin-dependent oxidoreductase (luciferase family)